MSRILLTLLLAASICPSFAQTFEGIIIYKTTYISKLPNVNNDQLTEMMGTTQEYAIKKGNYKTSSNGKIFQWQIYRNSENKLYNKMSQSETLLWNDGSINQDEFVKAEINKHVIEILGYPCDELIITCKNSTQKHYYNSKLKIDVRAFEKLKYGSWNEVISRTRAIPLKMIVDVAQYQMECIATEIKRRKLDDSVFELPAGSKSEKSPY